MIRARGAAVRGARPIGLALGAALVLAACQTDLADGTPDGYETADATRCTDIGGTYTKAGILQQFVCIVPTPDAGQACATAKDCSGFCMAETRTCSKLSPMFGCHGILTETGDRVEICID